ncbi:MAG: peptidyl-Lys metalloendopeptidase [Yoonia sp.]
MIIIAASFVFFAQPAMAQRYAGCSVPESEVVDDALGSAKFLTLRAASAIGDTTHYRRWFGGYSMQNAEKVRSRLKSMVTAIRGGAVTVQCNQATVNGCRSGEYAFVFANSPFLVNLCPPFFNLPHLEALQPGMRRSENGTREGTIVHELSHFLRVAGTEDYCYSRSACADMASRDARRAIGNADSYQYFTEDVTYFARQPLANKPPPPLRNDR